MLTTFVVPESSLCIMTSLCWILCSFFRVVEFVFIILSFIFLIFFSQLDIRGDPYGLLGAHPIAPLVTLHHIDYLNSLFPNRTQLDSLETLIHAYRIDPNRILQQSLCYDTKREWSISISWGYTIQIYPLFLSANNLAMPLQTFKTWRSWGDGPFVFNTRPVSPDPCDNPVIYFLDRVENVGRTGTRTIYTKSGPLIGKNCDKPGFVKAMEVKTIIVSALKLDPKYWHKVGAIIWPFLVHLTS